MDLLPEAPTPPEGVAEIAKDKKQYLKKFIQPNSDDEEFDPDYRQIYNVAESWRTLLSLPTCQKVMVIDSVQKALKIEVGVNVTQEFPWKQVQFKLIHDILFDTIENVIEVAKVCKGFNPEHYILMGYCPILIEQEDEPPEGDPFIFFVGSKDAKLAMSIIQNMEGFERWRMRRRLRKKPRRWISYGSENEMTILCEQLKDEPVDVEIQSVYPIQQPKHVKFSFRPTRAVRDGVIELLPSESAKFDNVTRRRITIGIQSAPVKVDREQQTNPTFPSNAWSQYLYEIDNVDLELDESDVDEEEKEKEKGRSTQASPEPVEEEKPPPQMSRQIEFLLNTLEFNQIDSYRNDYQMISNKHVVHYSNPFLQEFICFANISKSNKRFVAGHDWYPNMSGLIATSYAFSTAVTVDNINDNVDWVQRAVLEPNPVLLWSFSDNLNYKLEFESPFETCQLSFCPYKGDYLIGGCKNGQLVIWDLQGRCERLDQEEYLTAAQAKYRTLIQDFLKWTIALDEESVIPPALMTPLEVSPQGAITGIYWLSKHYYINNFGKIYKEQDKHNQHMVFITCSTDGSICFWDLEALDSNKDHKHQRTKLMPKELTQNESNLKGKILKPIYTLSFNEPIMAIIADTSVFAIHTPGLRTINASPANYPTSMESYDPPNVRQSMIVATMYGRIHRIEWMGVYTEGEPKEPVTSSVQFAMVHDGPIVAMCKNPFYPELFASIGRNVFAIWKEDFPYSPILWRKRQCDLTAVAWSETRPAVLYLTRIDGILEAWDLLARDDDACLSEILGGGIITAVIEHRPSLPNKILGIADYNSSIRMVKLPPSFDEPLEDELNRLIRYVEKQQQRKADIQAWEESYYEQNKDIIEAKREVEQEARKEMERIERGEQMNARMRQAGEENAEGDKTKPQTGLAYHERMAIQWDELNLNRMMTILMSRKQMDPEKLARETALEKERLKYEAAKKASVAQILASIDNEMAELRARILPTEVVDMQRSEMIQARAMSILEAADSYENIAAECFDAINKFQDYDRIDYIEFLERGRRRRQLLDQALGGNTERLLWYEENKDRLSECEFGYDFLFGISSSSDKSIPQQGDTQQSSDDLKFSIQDIE